jgi:hypothetical protein
MRTLLCSIMYHTITLEEKFSWTLNILAALIVLDLDHVEFTIQVLKLKDLPDEKVTITVSHLSVCDMDHFVVNVEIQLQQLTYQK